MTPQNWPASWRTSRGCWSPEFSRRERADENTVPGPPPLRALLREEDGISPGQGALRRIRLERGGKEHVPARGKGSPLRNPRTHHGRISPRGVETAGGGYASPFRRETPGGRSPQRPQGHAPCPLHEA